jgi:hypothetical protein
MSEDYYVVLILYVPLGSNVNMVTKSRRMKWVGYVTCREKKRNAYRLLVEKPYGEDHFED